jgi:flagellin
MSKSLEKLSSGLRINRAADDAAGLAISEKMRAQVKGLNQATRNAQDGISLIQTAEGALNETHSILQRMRELMVQAGNGTNQTEDLTAINEEIKQLQAEVDGVGNRTEFNGKKLLDGSLGLAVSATSTAAVTSAFSISVGSGSGLRPGDTIAVSIKQGIAADANDEITLTLGSKSQTLVLNNDADVATTTSNVTGGTAFNFSDFGIILTATGSGAQNVASGTGNIVLEGGATGGAGYASLQIGANGGQSLDVQIGSMKASALGVSSTSVDVTNFAATGFDVQLASIDGAISRVSSERSRLGAMQNRLDHTINNLGVAAENLTAANSRIRDVDMASEMMEFTRTQILTQAGTAMLAQANQLPQSVLQLLR